MTDKPQWYVRHATEEDIKDIAPRLRKADIDEIFAATGKEPEECLMASFLIPSVGVWVGVKGESPEILFGLARSADPDMGIPWMVATDELTRSPREFKMQCMNWVKGFSRQFKVLKNFVYSKNSVHIRWLKLCGFEFVELHEQYGQGKEPFWEFQLVRNKD